MENMQVKKDILAALTYFSLFDYPLRKDEIFNYLSRCVESSDFERSLASLLHSAAIYKIGSFYSLDDNHRITIRRLKGNEKAALMLKKAEKSAAIISAFPFIKGVAVSGSLSKHFADDNADIDFFIITTANRLWIARTFLHIFKKFTFIFNRQHDFCMNYFIDEADLSIQEKNIYTAIEASTILPLRGNSIFESFFYENSWTRVFLPNKPVLTQGRKIKSSMMRVALEKIINNRLGNCLDNFFMKWTARNWNAKTRKGKRDSKGLVLNMHINKHFAKANPERFQRPLLFRYETKLAEIHRRCELTRSSLQIASIT